MRKEVEEYQSGQDEKIRIIKEFKSSTDLTEIRKKHAAPNIIHNHIFEELKNKLEKQMASNNSVEKRINLEKAKSKKVILKPIEIKDPRLYAPASTNTKFELPKQVSTNNFNQEKNIKNRLLMEEIRENEYSPISNGVKRHPNFAKTTYADNPINYNDYEKVMKKQLEYYNNETVYEGPMMRNSTLTINPNATIKAPSKIRLEELITVKVLKRNKNLGVVKKVVHAPTLRLYAVKVT